MQLSTQLATEQAMQRQRTYGQTTTPTRNFLGSVFCLWRAGHQLSFKKFHHFRSDSAMNRLAWGVQLDPARGATTLEQPEPDQQCCCAFSRVRTHVLLLLEGRQPSPRQGYRYVHTTCPCPFNIHRAPCFMLLPSKKEGGGEHTKERKPSGRLTVGLEPGTARSQQIGQWWQGTTLFLCQSQSGQGATRTH